MTDQVVFWIILPLHLLVIILCLVKKDFMPKTDNEYYRASMWAFRGNLATLLGWVLFLGINYFNGRVMV